MNEVEAERDRHVAVAMLLAVGGVIARGLGRSARMCAAAVQAVEPGVWRFLAQAPLVGLTQLTSRQGRLEAMDDDGRRVVVFVHGLGGHRGNFLPMGSFFRAVGRRRSISVGFAHHQTIEDMAQQLSEMLETIVEVNALPSGQVIDLVCHSMGGIVARAALQDPQTAARVANLVTMGTPHHGTGLARFARTTKILGLRPGSDLLTQLEEQLPWTPGPQMPPLTCLWSPSDLIMMPAECARVPGAENIRMEGYTHLSFLLTPQVWYRVLKALDPAGVTAEELC